MRAVSATNIAAKYTPALSWFYDRAAADAVLNATSGLIDRIQTAVTNGDAVLEVGCGGGQFALRLIERLPGIRVTGVDLSAEQLSRAAARANRLSPEAIERVGFREASALDLPFSDRSFDIAVSIASIKHWPDRQRGVREMVRVLKEGGLLLIAETDRSCHLDDVRTFVRDTHLPALLRTPYLWMFRTYVAGQGLDLGDAREALADQPLVDTTVQRIADTPFLTMTGIKV